MRFLLVLVMTMSSFACMLGYDGTQMMEMCADIAIGTPISELPVSNDPVWYNLGMNFRGEAHALSCCQSCGWGERDCGGCDVSCADPAIKAEAVELGGHFHGRCNDRGDGAAHCSVWVREGKVVGTWFFCYD